ncbi:DNA translocase FtsK 4TM domain-containing protein [Saccharicrinis sp. FJH62]|uniref:FtsK/SpoIIIE family DNA translocase n=1 Tax=Saccharicrinis sp. FJH62 TaxID=3344657 RepID=UPI0035D4BABB
MPRSKTKKTKSKQKKSSHSFRQFFQDEKVRFTIGTIIIVFTLYLTLSFISFFFTGGADQSKLDLPWGDLIKSPDIRVQNWAGKTGAFLADRLINRGFGIAALFYSFFLGVVGFRFFNVKIVKVRHALVWSLLGLIWFSLFFGFFFIDNYEDTHLFLGGIHGYYISIWLNAAIGKFGTFSVIILTLLLFFIFSFSNSISILKSLPGRLKSGHKEMNPDVPMEEPKIEAQDDKEAKEVDLSDDGEPVIEEEIVERVVEETVEPEPETREEENEPEDEDDDVTMTVEEGEEEEVVKKAMKTEDMEDYDPTLDLSRYKYPGLDLLVEYKNDEVVTDEELYENKNKIVRTLESYGISIDKIKATIGPTVTLYEIIPAKGVRIAKIKNLEDDIALSLSALGIRIIAPIPGKGTIGIEVPNSRPEVVSMRSVIASKKFQESKYELPVAIGKTITNETFTFDLVKMPHLLVAGATGQGKSVGLNAILASLLFKKHPAQLKFVLIDPKKVELSIYTKIENHFLATLPDADESIITDVQKVVQTLNSLTIEMDARYDLLKKAHARNIKEYNTKFIKRKLNPDNGHRFLPYIVVVIDEFADLIMTAGKEVELPIARIAQLARAIGIHMIIATQRPSTNIITGVIKANFPARIAFKVSQMIDSRTILDTPGANHLIGRGDMLISYNSELVRVQCAFVDTPEVEEIVTYIGDQQGYQMPFQLPEYESEEVTPGSAEDLLASKDSLFEEAARIVVAHQSGSTSLLQRRFSIGYNRAGRIMDQLEAASIVGPFEGSKARKVLIPDEISLEHHLNAL